MAKKIIMQRDTLFDPQVLLEINRKYEGYTQPSYPMVTQQSITNNFIPEQVQYQQEKWRQICLYLPYIRDEYYISNYGKIYSNFKNDEKLAALNNKGYYFTALKGKDNNIYQYLIHRLVAICFMYRADYADMIVNHIDSNSTNNCVWNLEWCTYSENNKHAFAVGARIPMRGEQSPNSVLTNEDVNTICIYLAKNYDTNDILDKINLPHTKVNQNIISKVYNREIWTHISQKYDFPSKEEKARQSTRMLNNYLVHEICKRLEKKMKFKDICNELNIEYSDSVRVIIGQIRNGKKYTEISKDYNIPRDNSLKLTNEQLHKICQGISDGLSSREILHSVGLQPNDNTRSIFYCIKGRKKHKDISKDYIW